MFETINQYQYLFEKTTLISNIITFVVAILD